MALLKLSPSTKDYLWGGQRLITEYGKHTDKDKIAETWELSCHPDGPSYVELGDNKRITLKDYIAENGEAILGTNSKVYDDFPILIKLIDAKENLSIQVHPDDNYALKNEHQFGKTEMWYVIDAKEDSYLYYGLNQDVTKDELRKAIADNTILDLLNKVKVKKGDIFFIEAGTIHAIGKGLLIAEIQQNSNVTYRVYDYNRKDASGHTRELHVDKSIDVINLKRTKLPNFTKHLGVCNYFCVDRLSLDGSIAKSVELYADHSSFVSILVLNGNGIISDGKTSYTYQKGESYLVTAASGNFTISGEIEALITTIPENKAMLDLKKKMSLSA